jgi:RNA polymerase sigma-70 factor (ECF subfamily)
LLFIVPLRIVTDPHVYRDRDEPTSTASTSLIERVKAFDQAAWERLVELYSPLVYAWCRRAGLQEADALDVGQEVFRAVAGAIVHFHRDQPGDSFRRWLRTITRNKIHDFFRSQNAGERGADGGEEVVMDMDAVLPDTDSESLAAETLILYRRAVELIRGEFSEQHFQAFWQVVVEERSPTDVAAELGMTVNAVYSAKSRILRRLREEFAGLLDDSEE